MAGVKPLRGRRRVPRGSLLPRSERQLAQRVWPERIDSSSAGVIESINAGAAGAISNRPAGEVN